MPASDRIATSMAARMPRVNGRPMTAQVPATMPNVVAGLLRLLDSYLLPLVSHVGN